MHKAASLASSLERQRTAIRSFADRADYDIVSEHYDPAVKGADPVHQRPAFAAMMATIAGNGVRTIIVETASRFARDLIVQETGFQYLRGLGITLIAADDPDAFAGDTPTQVMVRQILGAVSQFQEADLVAKLAAARARKKAAGGHAEGPKPAPEAAKALAKRLHRRGLSLRAVSAQLAEKGFLAPSGKPYGAQSVKVMLGTKSQPRSNYYHWRRNLEGRAEARAQADKKQIQSSYPPSADAMERLEGGPIRDIDELLLGRTNLL